ncbi:hypothetical protein MPSEU_000775700 [Mayamaea pseudoterrestris]|nr:hypothetical protein MPSEU_000775700 [Mayamaea pseudoterrestris]
MVFLSTVQALVGRPLSRNVFAFGTRQLDKALVVEEIAMNIFLVFPLSMILAAMTIRIAAKSIPFIRSDIYTTMLITIVGDIFLEILLPSLQCLPMDQPMQNDMSYIAWLSQTWGFQCPPNLGREALLTTDAVGTLLTIRLIFMCVGVYLGEAFVPIALTGGIASGKTTVAQLLQDPKRLYAQKSSRRKKQKSTTGSSGNTLGSMSGSGTASGLSSFVEGDDEGSFDVIDVDRIAHEVLLPPSVLKGDDPAPDVELPYTTPPEYSLYEQIVQVFENHDILDEYGMIDRRKLGAVIFQDHSLRLQLNRLTHPRILFLLLRKIARGVFVGSKDIICADIPLLFESGQLRRLFALTICVAAPKELQFERLRKRNPDISLQECWHRINSQMPMEEKLKRADIVIWNTGDMDALSEDVEKLRRDVIGRIFGVGMSLLQMLLLVGGSLSLAVSSKLFT